MGNSIYIYIWEPGCCHAGSFLYPVVLGEALGRYHTSISSPFGLRQALVDLVGGYVSYREKCWKKMWDGITPAVSPLSLPGPTGTFFNKITTIIVYKTRQLWDRGFNRGSYLNFTSSVGQHHTSSPFGLGQVLLYIVPAAVWYTGMSHDMIRYLLSTYVRFWCGDTPRWLVVWSKYPKSIPPVRPCMYVSTTVEGVNNEARLF